LQPLIERIKTNIKGNDIDLTLTRSHVVLYGPNGGGKTALLNALQWHFLGQVSDLGGREGSAKAGYLVKLLGPGMDQTPECLVTYQLGRKLDTVRFLGADIRSTFGASAEPFLEFAARLSADFNYNAALQRDRIRTALKSVDKQCRALRNAKKVLEEYGHSTEQVDEDLKFEVEQAKSLRADLETSLGLLMQDVQDVKGLLEGNPVGFGKFGTRFMWTWRGSPYFSGAERVMLQCELANLLAMGDEDVLNFFVNEDRWMSESTWSTLLARAKQIPNTQVILQTPSKRCLEIAQRHWGHHYQIIDLS
jgi:energy-coupling factor transporter ATP-binding protein EcfA2